MVAKQRPESSIDTVADGLGEAIDLYELRRVLLGVRELISQTRCQALVRELLEAHDRISEIKIVDRARLARSGRGTGG